MSDVQTNQERIRRLESALRQIEKQGLACKKALDRWGTDALAKEHAQLQEAWTAYNTELKKAKASQVR